LRPEGNDTLYRSDAIGFAPSRKPGAWEAATTGDGLGDFVGSGEALGDALASGELDAAGEASVVVAVELGDAELVAAAATPAGT